MITFDYINTMNENEIKEDMIINFKGLDYQNLSAHKTCDAFLLFAQSKTWNKN